MTQTSLSNKSSHASDVDVSNGELLPNGETLQHTLPAVTKKANEYSKPG